MAACTNENWTLQDLTTALQDMHKDNKKLVVPMFQRGKRWTKSQERTFIDSLINISETKYHNNDYIGSRVRISSRAYFILSIIHST